MHHRSIYPFSKEALPILSRGLTLLELLVAIAVLSILLSVGIPSFASLSQDLKLKGAGFALFETIHLAQTEAIKRNIDTVAIRFFVDEETNTNWCYRITDQDVGICDSCLSNQCDIEGDGITRGSNSSDYAGVKLEPSYSQITVSNRWGTLPSGNAAFAFNKEKELHVKTSSLGRIRVCMDSGTIIGVDKC